MTIPQILEAVKAGSMTTSEATVEIIRTFADNDLQAFGSRVDDLTEA